MSEYHKNEMKRFQVEVAEHSKASRAEFIERMGKLRECWTDYPEIFGERVNWVFNGSYGYGAMVHAIRIAEGSKRANRAAALSQLTALVEWQLPENYTRKVWKTLTTDQQARVTAIVAAELQYFEENREQFEEVKP